jgi:hypothetical protein
MKKTLTLLIALTFIATSYSQAELMGFRDYRDIADSFYMNFEGSDKFNVEDVNGTPFLGEGFEYGYIIDTKGKNKSQTFLRYDVYNDIFEIQLDPNDESLKTLERTPRFQYTLNGEKFVLIQTDVLNDAHYTSGNGYAVELTSPEANTVLYKRYYKELKPGSKGATSYQPDVPPSISSNLVYIVKLGDSYVEAEDHKKKILDAFPSDKQGALKKFIKAKGFKLKGSDQEVQNEMIQIVRYYNSI